MNGVIPGMEQGESRHDILKDETIQEFGLLYG